MLNELFVKTVGTLLSAVLLFGAIPGCANAATDISDNAVDHQASDAASRPELRSEKADTSHAARCEIAGSSDARLTVFSRPAFKWDDGEHAGYVTGYDDGTFRPNDTITRAQAASLLYRLLERPGSEFVRLEDVSETAYYYTDVGYLAAIGVLDITGGTLNPDEYLTRAEFTSMIVRLMVGDSYKTYYGSMPFDDVPEDHRYAGEIAYAEMHGWVYGVGNREFYPDRMVSRGEAVATINRAMGAVPDKEYLSGLFFSPFSDVFATHWAYYDILEATLTHTHVGSGSSAWRKGDIDALRHEEGLYFIGTDYYYIGADGMPVMNDYVGYRYFGADGLYTSGDDTIDGYVEDVLSRIIKPEMTSLEKLRAAYLYTRDSFSYLTRNYYESNATGWDIKEATTMFTTKRGNCYCYAAVFEFLARQLGYDAVAVSGMCSPNNPHGWVEINIDGTDYMFDTELEMAHRKQGRNTNLYMIPMDQLPWSYWR